MSASAEYRFKPSAIRDKFLAGTNASKLITIHGGEQMTLLGRIEPDTWIMFKNITEKESKLREVYVDSTGGDLESALHIAEIIKNKKLHLIVDGRCFSACAHFLFVAAEKKTVLANSLVGIHEATFWASVDGKKIAINENDVSSKLSGKDAKELAQLKLKMEQFYKAFNIKPQLFDAYKRFNVARNRTIFDAENAYSASCPEIGMWALNKQQLISMGVKGIDEFWYPQNEVDKERLIDIFNFPPAWIYFGDDNTLGNFCRGNPILNWFDNRYHMLIKLFS